MDKQTKDFLYENAMAFCRKKLTAAENRMIVGAKRNFFKSGKTDILDIRKGHLWIQSFKYGEYRDSDGHDDQVIIISKGVSYWKY